ncbi:hypothetical protein NP493_334g03000 [Ridgeia piscesae]|uniref:Uncharacterized protein n=1 Tax=Ridgeia piscesae TaxID=27915 RepID=A0AAD9L4R5_RIDPI|nr:hypothetical protein NP493_334g03000 [Ridgeia piscesae]
MVLWTRRACHSRRRHRPADDRPILAERHRTNGAEMATHGSSCRWTWTSHSLNRTLRHNRVPVVRNTVLSERMRSPTTDTVVRIADV